MEKQQRQVLTGRLTDPERVMNMDTASEQQVQSFLEQHPSWSLAGGKLHKVFLFGSFPEAFGFIAQVAIIAESMDHHPEWSNTYNRVVVDLVTHQAGGITDRDFSLAEIMDAALKDGT